MTEDFITGNKGKDSKKEFGEIVLSHLRRILAIASNPEDKGKYIASVETLGHILLPYFDDSAKKVYNEFEGVFYKINGFEILGKKFKDEFELFKLQLSKSFSRDSYEYPQYTKAFWKDKELQCAKELFIELNNLLKRQEYLKSSVYGDGFSEGFEE